MCCKRAVLTGPCTRPGQVALTPASDTSDLLGPYEQAEPSRAREAAEQRLIADARVACAAVAASGDFDAAAAVEALWHSYTSAAKSGDAAARSAALQAACASTTAATAAASPAVASAWSASLATSFDLVTPAGSVPSSSGSFEWVDGILLKAMAAGDWVLLDNANLCSPTVLDRLNPLLEPAGELLVPEAGLVNGAPRIATPAHGFRVLLALDPSHGEVSRAMRNRGIEVFLLQSDDSSRTVRARSSHSAYMRIASIRVLAGTSPMASVSALGSAAKLCAQRLCLGRMANLFAASTAHAVSPCALAAAAVAAAFSPVRHTCRPSPH